ncbi:MAG: Hpt domain-containing protein [bacterium]|nr:Hpt domain-containing protein [bacterium]
MTGESHDREALQRLRRLDPDGALFRKWVRRFLIDAPLKLATIERALEAGGLSSVVRGAHSLKSLAGWLGGRRVMILCEQLEREARAGDQEACRPYLSALQRELPLFRDWLTGRLEAEARGTEMNR